MTEHNHNHKDGCCEGDKPHDHNANVHCHCDSCTIQKSAADGMAANGSYDGGDGDDGGDGGDGDGGDGGDGDQPHQQCHGCDDCCGCGCDHEHGDESIEPKQILRLCVGAVFFVSALLLDSLSLPEWVIPLLFLAAYLIIGGDVLLRAGKNILHGQLFDENFLMAIATIGAFAIGEFPEGIAVMLFYQVGELFQSYAVGRSRRSITELMDIRPDHANLALADGSTESVAPDSVTVGSQIIIKPGEKIPLDSTVLEGSSFVDTAALTGESVPRSVQPGDALLSGCINQSGLLRAEVSKEFGQSTVSRILELAESAGDKKAQTQQFITRFAKVYTPLVVLAAVLLAAIPPIFIEGQLFSDWLYRALVFLVISCPCALVISVPLSFFGGIGGASRCGVLVKGGNYLEALAKAEIVVFDKTGTLTHGSFTVTSIIPEGITEEQLLASAAAVESFSTHPIARSIVTAYGKKTDPALISQYAELSGRGVTAMVDGCVILAGNRKLMDENNIAVPLYSSINGTEVLVAIDGRYSGRLVISDTVKGDACAAIKALKGLGIRRTVMLTGDSEASAGAVAAAVGIDSCYSQLLPADKVMHIEELMKEKSSKGTLIFVGDGINDAPVLARADIGVAMGGLGSDAAIEAADVVLMTDQPMRLVTGIRVARRTTVIVRQNVIFALGVKLIVMTLGAAGFASMWLAVFADVGVSVLAILNAIRALNTKRLMD